MATVPVLRDARVTGSGAVRWLESARAIALAHGAPSPPARAMFERLAGKALVGHRTATLFTLATPTGSALRFAEDAGIAVVVVQSNGTMEPLNQRAQAVLGTCLLEVLRRAYGREFDDSAEVSAKTRFTCPSCGTTNPEIVVDWAQQQIVCQCNSTLFDDDWPGAVAECDGCGFWRLVEDVAFDACGGTNCADCIGPLGTCDICGSRVPVTILSERTAAEDRIKLTLCDYDLWSVWAGQDKIRCCYDNEERVAERFAREARRRHLTLDLGDWAGLTTTDESNVRAGYDWGLEGVDEDIDFVGGFDELDEVAPRMRYE